MNPKNQSRVPSSEFRVLSSEFQVTSSDVGPAFSSYSSQVSEIPATKRMKNKAPKGKERSVTTYGSSSLLLSFFRSTWFSKWEISWLVDWLLFL